MADILIRGMEMPGTCFMCPLSFMNGERLFCHITKEEVLKGKIAPECPLVELPEHGDLIDKQAVFKALSEKFKSSDGFVSWTDAIDIVLRAQEIVPSNKEDAK